MIPWRRNMCFAQNWVSIWMQHESAGCSQCSPYNYFKDRNGMPDWKARKLPTE